MQCKQITTQSAFANAKCLSAVDESIGDKQISARHVAKEWEPKTLPEWEKIKSADSTVDVQ